MRNVLYTSLAEFNSALSLFSKTKIAAKSSLLAFDGKYLSIEWGSRAAAMVASGEWHGRAIMSSQVIRALVSNPPTMDPVHVIFEDGKIQIAGICIPCIWQQVSKRGIRRAVNPSTLELLAIEKTVERHELGQTPLGKKCSTALQKYDLAVEGAMKHLSEFGVNEEQIRFLIDKNIEVIISQSESS
jgi:hypothetical protein